MTARPRLCCVLLALPALILTACMTTPELRRADAHAAAGRCTDARAWLERAIALQPPRDDTFRAIEERVGACAVNANARARATAHDERARARQDDADRRRAEAERAVAARRRAEAEQTLAAADRDPAGPIDPLWRLYETRALGLPDLEPRVERALAAATIARLEAGRRPDDTAVERALAVPAVAAAIRPALTARIDADLAEITRGPSPATARRLAALATAPAWAATGDHALAPAVDALLATGDPEVLRILAPTRGFGDPALDRAILATADRLADARLTAARAAAAAGDCPAAIRAIHAAQTDAPPSPALIDGLRAIGRTCAQQMTRRASGRPGTRLWWLTQAAALTGEPPAELRALRDPIIADARRLDDAVARTGPRKSARGKTLPAQSYAVAWRQTGRAGACADVARRLVARLPPNDRLSAAAEKIWADIRIDIDRCTFDARLGPVRTEQTEYNDPRTQTYTTRRTEQEQYCATHTVDPATGHGRCTQWGSRPRTVTTTHTRQIDNRTVVTRYTRTGNAAVEVSGTLRIEIPGRPTESLPIRYTRTDPIIAEISGPSGPVTHVRVGGEGPFNVSGQRDYMRYIAGYGLERYLGGQADRTYDLYQRTAGGHGAELTRRRRQAAQREQQQAIAALQQTLDRAQRNDDALDALTRLLLRDGYRPRPAEQRLIERHWQIPGASPDALLRDPTGFRLVTLTLPEPPSPRRPPTIDRQPPPPLDAPASTDAPPDAPPADPATDPPPDHPLWLSTGRLYSRVHGRPKARHRPAALTLGFAAATTPVDGAAPGAHLRAGLHLGILTLDGHFATPLGPLDGQSGFGVGAWLTLTTHDQRHWATPSTLIALGLAYQSHDIHGAAPGAPRETRALDIPLRVTVPLWDWISVDAELRGNILQLFDGDGRYSLAAAGLTLYAAEYIHLHLGATAHLGADDPLGALAELMLRL